MTGCPRRRGAPAGTALVGGSTYPCLVHDRPKNLLLRVLQRHHDLGKLKTNDLLHLLHR